jgi:hypothetical protein
VRLARLVVAKAEVFRAMRQAGIDKAELAQRLGIAPEAVDQLFSIHHETGLDQIGGAPRARVPIGCGGRHSLIGTTLPIWSGCIIPVVRSAIGIISLLALTGEHPKSLDLHRRAVRELGDEGELAAHRLDITLQCR